MSALTRARTWSTNRHDQEQARSAESAARHVSSATTATTTTTRLNTEYVAVARDGRLVKDTTCAAAAAPDPEAEPIAHPTFLQPRVAAVLGVSEWWHPVLFSLRLLSILPSIYLCFPVAIRFLLKLHAFATSDGVGAAQGRTPGEDRLLLVETMLAIVWCGCSGYLSFFFTDCLMSRW